MEDLATFPTLVGALLLALTFHDLISTAVSVSSGAGPLTARIGRWMWRASLRLHERIDAPWVLQRTGPTILFTVMAAWTALLIVGWALVFGQPETIITVEDGEPAAFLGSIYFASATVTGIGSTGLSTSTDAWQAVEQLAAASGVALLGLSVAYVLPVVQAVVTKREIAAYSHAVGDDAIDMSLRCWNGQDFGELDLHLIPLTADLAGLAERYLAYPVLHYFHSSERRTAIGPAVASLDGIVALHRRVLAASVRIDGSVIGPLERAIDAFLHTVDPPRSDAPVEAHWPGIEQLREAGIPLHESADETAMSDADVHRRNRIIDYLTHDGWATQDVRATAR